MNVRIPIRCQVKMPTVVERSHRFCHWCLLSPRLFRNVSKMKSIKNKQWTMNFVHSKRYEGWVYIFLKITYSLMCSFLKKCLDCLGFFNFILGSNHFQYVQDFSARTAHLVLNTEYNSFVASISLQITLFNTELLRLVIFHNNLGKTSTRINHHRHFFSSSEHQCATCSCIVQTSYE